MKKIIVILLALGLFSCSHNTDLAREENSLILPPEFDSVPSALLDNQINQSPTKNLNQKDLQKLKDTLLKQK
jgi:hypothetical protein